MFTETPDEGIRIPNHNQTVVRPQPFRMTANHNQTLRTAR
jgi:hypothetical protein